MRLDDSSAKDWPRFSRLNFSAKRFRFEEIPYKLFAGKHRLQHGKELESTVNVRPDDKCTIIYIIYSVYIVHYQMPSCKDIFWRSMDLAAEGRC